MLAGKNISQGHVKNPVPGILQDILPKKSGGDRLFGTSDKDRQQRVRDYEKPTKIIADKPWHIGQLRLPD